MAAIFTSRSGTHLTLGWIAVVLGGFSSLMVVKCCSPGCKAVNVFTVLPLSVARDCWTCEDSETHSCDDNVSLFLQCECRTEDPSSPDA